MNSTRNFPRTASTPRQRTENQLTFLVDLVTQIGAYDAERGRELWFELRDQDQAGLLTFTQASDTISALKDERNGNRLAQHVDPTQDRAPRPEVPEGRYAVLTDDGHLAFYRVRVADTGFISVELQVSDEHQPLAWKTAVAVLRKIEVDPKAAAIRYGQELGVCGVCGRTLTDEASRAAGIGPVCSSRL